MKEPASQIEVNLKAKKTEEDWIESVDKFWLAFTPKLFEWLGWVALLAGIRFIHTKSPSIWLGLIIGLCTTSLMFYFIAFFNKYKFIGIPWVHSQRGHLLASLIISVVLAFIANQVAYYSAIAIAKGQP